MTIEVKQMVIKSTVQPGLEEESSSKTPEVCSSSVKTDVLEECRQLVLEMMEKMRER